MHFCNDYRLEPENKKKELKTLVPIKKRKRGGIELVVMKGTRFI